MTNLPPVTGDEAEQDAWLKSLLDDSANSQNPLLPALAFIYQREQELRVKLARLMHISDGYHDFARAQAQTLLENYEKQSVRLEKISRISDRYQETMRELNENLKQAALRDPLTLLANRRLFLSRLKEEETRSQRLKTHFGIIMLDVDHFKRFNDEYGHNAGDIVLCRMAEAINESLRNYDLCARWGGEEFIILLPDTHLEMAIGVAERALTAVRTINITDIDTNLTLTASIGLAIYRSTEDCNDTINRADAALLQAKRNGRNRIEIAD